MCQPQKTYTLTETKKKLERYCAYQERCHQEVRNKLVAMRMIPEAIDHIMVHLIGEGYLNEERFTQNFVLGKFRQKQWGRLRLRQELKRRKIGDKLIGEALQQIEEEYETVFEALVQKRLAQLKGEKDKYRKRKKLADYLAYRGWEGEMIYEILVECI